ncbi:MAG: gamma-glutamylcyclotransferase family protein [Acidimicrobiia bacterium]|nr:gamma-glutamylcyclotransferase family protein [Acidimicrobiia bacterium]
MAATAPNAEFEFIAHLPEWGLEFPVESDTWGGALPTVTPTTGSTVWGAVFNVDDSALEALDEAEGAEHRVRTTIEAMDRMGRRHQVAVHLHQPNGSSNGAGTPSEEYLRIMLDGSRHWSLPAGWIAGLEEHLQGR